MGCGDEAGFGSPIWFLAASGHDRLGAQLHDHRRVLLTAKIIYTYTRAYIYIHIYIYVSSDYPLGNARYLVDLVVEARFECRLINFQVIVTVPGSMHIVRFRFDETTLDLTPRLEFQDAARPSQRGPRTIRELAARAHFARDMLAHA